MNLLNSLKNIRYKSSIGFFAVLYLYKLYVFYKYRLFNDEHYIKKSFKSMFGYDLDLEHPEAMNEKIQWYKLNYKHPLMVQCADKLKVREYISETIGENYLIPLFFHSDDYREIKPENLPDFPFIIKPNHFSGANCIVRNKLTVNWRKVQTDCRWWLGLNYYHMYKEWQYDKIKPYILAEKLLLDPNGEIPSDYKLHFFNGKFEFIQVDIERFAAHRKNYYDQNWNLLPFTWSVVDKKNQPKYGFAGELEKPKNLEQLIELGGQLAKPFPYVRVDFYIVDEKIYFGELTFHPDGGLAPFSPHIWDRRFGEKIPLRKIF